MYKSTTFLGTISVGAIIEGAWIRDQNYAKNSKWFSSHCFKETEKHSFNNAAFHYINWN